MRKLRQIAKAAIVTVPLFFSLSSLALAQDIIKIEPQETAEFRNLLNLQIGEIVSGLITLGLIIAAVVFFFMLVIGGIKWIVSGGDKTQTEGARNQITAALVGLVIVFSAWAIIQLIQNLFDIQIFGGDGISIPKFNQ